KPSAGSKSSSTEARSALTDQARCGRRLKARLPADERDRPEAHVLASQASTELLPQKRTCASAPATRLWPTSLCTLVKMPPRVAPGRTSARRRSTELFEPGVVTAFS